MTIAFPNTVRDIQRDAFYQASQLKSLITNEGLETLGNPDQQPDRGTFSNTRIEYVGVSSSVKKIEDHTFYGCKELRHVAIQEHSHLQSIGQMCFYGSNIKEFTIPHSVTEIGQGAFQECENLQTVTF